MTIQYCKWEHKTSLNKGSDTYCSEQFAAAVKVIWDNGNRHCIVKLADSFFSIVITAQSMFSYFFYDLIKVGAARFSFLRKTLYIQQPRELILPSIENSMGICKQVTLIKCIYVSKCSCFFGLF
jgi:hypothetical protein